MSDEHGFGTTEESCTLASSEPRAESYLLLLEHAKPASGTPGILHQTCWAFGLCPNAISPGRHFLSPLCKGTTLMGLWPLTLLYFSSQHVSPPDTLEIRVPTVCSTSKGKRDIWALICSSRQLQPREQCLRNIRGVRLGMNDAANISWVPMMHQAPC